MGDRPSPLLRSGPRLAHLLLLPLLLASGCTPPSLEATPEWVALPVVVPDPWDFLLVGGLIVDGTGAAGRAADVAIVGDRIVEVAPAGSLDPAHALQLLRLDGLVLAPGFIDINGQSDALYLEDGSALSKLFQGVTTEIMGESNSPAPLSPSMVGATAPGDSVAQRRAVEWQRFDGWLREMEAGGVALNVGSFLGGTTVRRYAMGLAQGSPTPAQLDTMRAVTARAMTEGAFGVATGLIYPPGSYAGTEELIEISRVVAEYGGIYITHMRSESYGILDAIEEAIRIGEGAGLPVEIFHLKAAGVDNWGRTEEILARIEGARARGVDIEAGMYPYTAASTGLTACFPPWVEADGALYRNLTDPAARERIREELLGPPGDWENWCRLATPQGSIVSSVSNPANVRFIGRSLDEVREMLGVVDWVEAAMQLVNSDRSRVGMIYFGMSEESVRRLLTVPWIKFGTDGAGWNPRGAGGQPHPRAYGSYPRILGHYVREEGILTLEEAVRRASQAVAERIGLVDRGVIRVGAFADLVAFDPEAIREVATYERPHQLSVGVVHLWVNGERVIAEGEATGRRPGRFLRGPGSAFTPPN